MSFTIDILPAQADNYIYLISDEQLGLAMVVDPGDADVVNRFLQKRDLHLALILNTHHHSDHTGGNMKLQNLYGAPIIGPAKEAHKIEGLSRGVGQGDIVTFSDLRGQVIETPGHTAGSLSFYFPSLKAVFSGDTLFPLGCGRVFEGTPAELWASLCKLRDLPDETAIYAGHEYVERNTKFALLLDGANADLKARVAEATAKRKQAQPFMPTTIQAEKKTNPFLRIDDPLFQKTLAKAGFPVDGAESAAIFGAMRSAKDRFAG